MNNRIQKAIDWLQEHEADIWAACRQGLPLPPDSEFDYDTNHHTKSAFVWVEFKTGEATKEDNVDIQAIESLLENTPYWFDCTSTTSIENNLCMTINVY